MFTRSDGQLVRGKRNHNIRNKRDKHGQVVVERQVTTLWGTPFGRWERHSNHINHSRARNSTR